MRLVLVRPLIAGNTGSVGRLALALDAELVLVGPLGFSLSERDVRRAGVGHWPQVRYRHVETLADAVGDLPRSAVFLFEVRSPRSLWQASFPTATELGPALVFGNENPGLPPELLSEWADRTYHIPMPGSARSLNLSNAVAVAAYEALRQRQLPPPPASGVVLPPPA